MLSVQGGIHLICSASPVWICLHCMYLNKLCMHASNLSLDKVLPSNCYVYPITWLKISLPSFFVS